MNGFSICLVLSALAVSAMASPSPLPLADSDHREASAGVGSNQLSREAESDYRIVRDYILRAAEKMPAESYQFKPTPEMRSFGQLIGHIADDQYRYCSAARGDKRSTGFEKNAPPKAEMMALLKTAFTYCDATYDAMNDGFATDTVAFSGRGVPKLTVLTLHAGHAWEHYGNIVVYMRLKGLIPPSSEKSK